MIATFRINSRIKAIEINPGAVGAGDLRGL